MNSTRQFPCSPFSVAHPRTRLNLLPNILQIIISTAGDRNQKPPFSAVKFSSRFPHELLFIHPLLLLSSFNLKLVLYLPHLFPSPVASPPRPGRLWGPPTQPPIQWVPVVLSLRVKRPGREADHSPASSAEVKECVGLYLHSPNTPPWCGAHLEHRDNFTFSLVALPRHPFQKSSELIF
jgi:hypothetical protein